MVVVAYRILVSAQGPLVLGFWVFGTKGLRVWGQGLTIVVRFTHHKLETLGSTQHDITVFLDLKKCFTIFSLQVSDKDELRLGARVYGEGARV